MSNATTGESPAGDTTSVPAEGRVHAVLLALSAAAFAFTCLLFWYLPEGISEKEESRIFVFSCVLVPLAGILGSWAVDRVKRLAFPTHQLFLPLFAFAHTVFWALAVHKLRDAVPVPAPKELVDLRPQVHALIVNWAAGNVVLFAFVALTRRWLGTRAFPLFVRWLDRLLPFVLVYALLPFVTPAPLPRHFLYLLMIAGFASFAHVELARFPRERGARYAFDALVLVGMILLVFDPMQHADVYHHNFYLGPVAAVRAGRTMLVDVNCQYGVGIIYFIAMVFDLGLKHVPPSVAGLAMLISVLALVQYTVIYATLRSITRSVPLSALVLALMILVPRFEQIGYPSSYPSTGAIRFLPGYLLLGCFALRGRLPRHRSWVFALEAFVIGATSIWSFESFVYVFMAYMASLVYETAHVRRGEIWTELEARLTPTVTAVSMFHCALVFFTHARSGEWPHWSRYFDYIRLYSTQEFGTLPVDPWSPWLLIAGVYALSLIALGYRRVALGKSDLETKYTVVFAMSALGIAQFTYYVGRSHPNNLFHVCLPAFFVGGFWFISAARKVPYAARPFRQSLVFVCYGVVTFLMLSAVPDVMKKFDHTLLSFVMTDRDWPVLTPTPRAADAEDLIQRYAPKARRVAFFTISDVQVETFLLTRRTSLWPVSYPIQDELIEEAKARIFATRTNLKAGDVIFVDTGSSVPLAADQVHLVGGVHAVERELFAGVSSRFGFEIVEARPSGVTALRLTAR